MNLFEKANIIKYHKERIGDYDLQILQQGWRNSDSQDKRYSVLLGIGNMNNKNILDIGCGYGALKSYIDKRYKNVKYIGIDLIPQFVAKAAEIYTNDINAGFLCGDFLKTDLPKVDFILASGLFGYRTENKNYFNYAIEYLFNKTNCGFGFNMLDYEKFGYHPLIKAHNKEEIIKFCNSLTKKIKVIDGYLSDDFTVFLYRE